jgi:hypothetical protein
MNPAPFTHRQAIRQFLPSPFRRKIVNNKHLVHYQRAQRVVTSIDSQPEDFPDGSKAATLCSSIKQELVRIAELDVIRSSSMSKRTQATAARAHAHKLLDNLVKKIISTGAVIALDRPDTKGMFVCPQNNASSQTLIADGRSLADKAATLIGLFTENGLHATFVNDMRSYADSLEHAMQLQTDSVGERVRANADIDETIRRLSALIERLDIVVRNNYANDPAKLTAWESARRLERPARSSSDADNNAPPPAPQQ